MNKLLKYNQAKYEIINIIASQNLKVGSRLPSERTLNKQFDFSLITLRRALKELTDQGYLEKRHGYGTVILRPISDFGRNGQMLFIEIGVNDTPPVDTYQMKKILRSRNIHLKVLIASNPDASISENAKDCIGIFVSGWITREWVSFLKMLDIPLLFIGAHPFMNEVPTITADWEKAASLMVKNIAAMGYKKIGLITGTQKYYPSYLINDGFCKTAKTLKIKLQKCDIVWQANDFHLEIDNFLNNDYDAIILEAGILSRFLLVCWNRDLADKPILGIIGNNNTPASSDKIITASFRKPIHIAAIDVFFESLNKPDYFNGPIMIKPEILDEYNKNDNSVKSKICELI